MVWYRHVDADSFLSAQIVSGIVCSKRQSNPSSGLTSLRRLKKFKKIYIEITNRCNLACSFCLPSNRSKDFMKPSSFEEILRRIADFTDHVSLHVLGEPLLHPQLGQLFSRCQDHALRVNLTTNGTLLSRNRAVLLGQQALRQINISLHSFEQQNNEAALDTYLNEILDFTTTAVSVSPVYITLRLWNLTQVPSSLGKASSRSILKRLEDYFRLTVPLNADIPTGRGIRLTRQVFLSMEQSFTWPHGAAPDFGSHGYCLGLRDHIAILVDGTVLPCCLDGEGDIPLGNIFQVPLDEILAGPRAATIRAGFNLQRVIDPVCRRCTYRQRFQHNNSGKPEGDLKHLQKGARDAA